MIQKLSSQKQELQCLRAQTTFLQCSQALPVLKSIANGQPLNKNYIFHIQKCDAPQEQLIIHANPSKNSNVLNEVTYTAPVFVSEVNELVMSSPISTLNKEELNYVITDVARELEKAKVTLLENKIDLSSISIDDYDSIYAKLEAATINDLTHQLNQIKSKLSNATASWSEVVYHPLAEQSYRFWCTAEENNPEQINYFHYECRDKNGSIVSFGDFLPEKFSVELDNIISEIKTPGFSEPEI